MWNWFRSSAPVRPAYCCLLVGQRPLVRLGVRVALTHLPDFGVHGEVDDASRIGPLLDAGPYVVVFDLGHADDLDRTAGLGTAGLGTEDGASAGELTVDHAAADRADPLAGIRRLSRRLPTGSRIVALIARPDPFLAGQALAAGARGCVADTNSPEQLRQAVVAVANNHVYLPPSLADEFLDATCDSPFARRLATLSPRECQVFRLIGQARTTDEVARELRLTEHAVSAYRDRLRQKLALRHDAELDYYARVWRQLHPDE